MSKSKLNNLTYYPASSSIVEFAITHRQYINANAHDTNKKKAQDIFFYKYLNFYIFWSVRLVALLFGYELKCVFICVCVCRVCICEGMMRSLYIVQQLVVGTFQVLLVRFLIHQCLDFICVANFHLKQPTLIVTWTINEGGRIFDGIIFLRYGSGDGWKQFTGSLNTLQCTAFVLLCQFGADFWQLCKHNVTKCFLCIIWNSNDANVSVHLDPLVFARVPTI